MTEQNRRHPDHNPAPALVLGLVLTFFAVGCESQKASQLVETVRDAPTVSDSTGIQIVTNPALPTDTQAPWEIDSTPVLRVGAVAGAAPYLFTSIPAVTRLPSGALVLVEGQTREIRVFDPDGHFVRKMGGRGQGPGEFASPPVLGIDGDTIVAFDQRAARVSLFDSTGAYLGNLILSTETLPEAFTGIMPRRQVVLRHGDIFLAGTTVPSNTRPGEGGAQSFALVPNRVGRQSVEFVLLSRSGGEYEERVLARFRAQEWAYVMNKTLPGINLFNRYFPRVAYGVSRDPVYVYATPPDTRQINVLDGTGRLMRIIRETVPMERVTSRAVSAYKAEIEDSARALKIPASDARRVLNDFTYPDSLSPYVELMVDSQGDVWARKSSPSGTGSRSYDVFDRRGYWIHTVEIPPRYGDVREIGDDYVLTVRTDTLGVPHAAVYRLGKKTSGE